MQWVDLTGRRFGALYVLSCAGKTTHPSGQSHTRWLCRCKCGSEKIIVGMNLTRGRTSSCGCRQSRLRHGHAQRHPRRSREYSTWLSMKKRCGSPSHPRYFGRGITVCKRWLQFENFFADMGSRPPNTSLERRDNNGSYEPTNCYWATRREQSNNTCRTMMIEHEGHSQSIANWARQLGISRHTLTARIKRGWTIERAFYEPIPSRRKLIAA